MHILMLIYFLKFPSLRHPDIYLERNDLSDLGRYASMYYLVLFTICQYTHNELVHDADSLETVDPTYGEAFLYVGPETFPSPLPFHLSFPSSPPPSLTFPPKFTFPIVPTTTASLHLSISLHRTPPPPATPPPGPLKPNTIIK